ncbi:MAG: putative cytosol aminopeptidase [Phycisphaerales bacterium]|nr:MAG: putative cytosol aminopeptidase [Phycisphaerales bacterium]
MFDAVAVKKPTARQKPQCLVVGVVQRSAGGRGGSGAVLGRSAKALDADGSIAQACGRAECTGEVGAIAQAFPGKGGPAERVLVLGLGPAASLSAEVLRTAVAAAGRVMSTAGVASVRFELDDALQAADRGENAGPDRLDEAEAFTAVGESLGLLGWRCEQFRGTVRPATKKPKLAILEGSAARARALRLGLGLAEGANLARTLSQTPPNVATPAWMASQARKLSRLGLKVTVLRGEQLRRERLEGHINVGKASENDPHFIRIEYRPKGASGRSSARARPLVLVGKTMTYDTGGLSLKVNNGMVGMKRDKDGGCAVLGAMHIIATTIKPKVPVVALLCAAENSISDEAYRPDDVLTFRNGVTVEVTNTDAEGRLVLADGLCWACEKEKPAAVVDIATLTGGVVVALGSTFAGLWCEDASLREKVESASRATGERLWRLPMHEEYRQMMKSPVADIVNSNPNRKAHPIQGAAFLSYFVDPKVPWCHIDIAGTHAVDADAGPYVAGPTGYGARLLARLAERL